MFTIDLLVKKGNPKDFYKDFHEIGKGAYGLKHFFRIEFN